MKRDIIIGIDAGTSVIKSIAFDLGGRQVAISSRPNSYVSVAEGGVEQDMARTWSDTAATLRGLADLVPNLADRTAVVAVTGQGDGTWMIDADGRPVHDGWLWLDVRAGQMVDDIRSTPKVHDLYRLTGAGLAACQQGPQLLWLKTRRPDLVEKAATAFHPKDWLYFRLTGERATCPAEATFTFGDFRTRAYEPRVLDILGISDLARLQPRIVDGTREVGALSAAAAAECGLGEGTPVALAYLDVICTALGAGVYEPGIATGCTVVGSTGMHMRFVPSAAEVTLNADATGYTMAFPLPGAYAQMQSNMASTLNIDWLLNLAVGILGDAGVQRERADLLKGLDERVMAAEPGSVLYHPYISEAGERGPFVDPTARAQFLGLNLRTGFNELMRGVYEGLAFASRDCYSAMGAIPAEIRVTGGAARSKALRTILGAVLERPVRTMKREEAGAAGAAMIAAVGTGIYPDMDSCVAEWVTPLLDDPLPVDTALARRYEPLFPVYVEARRQTKPVWRALQSIRSPVEHG
jgi:erythritol kinase